MQKATHRSKLLGLLAISVGLSVIQPTTSFAAVIIVDTTNTLTFNDTAESLTLTLSPGGSGNNFDATVGCTAEICAVNLNPPTGYGSSGINISLPLYILEPGSNLISDIITLDRNSSTGVYTVTFTSDGDPDGLGTYGQPGFTGGTTVTENGSIQDGFILDWNSTTQPFHVYRDIIQFASDVDSTTTGVPEPMSLALFGAGLLGLGALRRRTKAKQ